MFRVWFSLFKSRGQEKMGKKTETQRLITGRLKKKHFWLWFQCLTKWWNVLICNFGVCGGVCFVKCEEETGQVFSD